MRRAFLFWNLNFMDRNVVRRTTECVKTSVSQKFSAVQNPDHVSFFKESAAIPVLTKEAVTIAADNGTDVSPTINELAAGTPEESKLSDDDKYIACSQ